MSLLSPKSPVDLAHPRRGWAALSAEGVVLLLLAAFLLVPLALAIGKGFIHEGKPSLYWFGRVASNPILRQDLVNGVVLASLTTLATMVLGVPLAVLRGRCKFAGQAILGVLVLVPLILPPFVGALSIKHLLSQDGVLNLALARIGLVNMSAPGGAPDWLGSGFPGVVLLQSLNLFPILYLNASAALANIDPAYSQAARNLGASPIRTFFRITLPLMRPGLFAGATIVFIWSFTDIGTPLIVGYQELVPVVIFKEISGADYTPLTFSLVFIMLSSSVALYAFGKVLFGRTDRAESSKASVAQETRRLGWLGTLGAWALFGGVILLALLPHVGVILTAFADCWMDTILPESYTLQHFTTVLKRADTYGSLLNSLKYAGASTAIDLIAGCTAAWLIVRSKVRGKEVLDGLAMLPLAVPGLILAAGYVVMTAWGPLRSIGPTQHAWVILIIAYSVRRLPFVVRGISAGLQQVPVSLEEAARNLGAGPKRTVLRITAPLVLANIIAAGVLTFAFAVLEVSDSLILAQTERTFPITKAIYRLATSGNVEAAGLASALGVYGMLFLGGTMAIASALLGRRLGAIFRA